MKWGRERGVVWGGAGRRVWHGVRRQWNKVKREHELEWRQKGKNELGIRYQMDIHATMG